MIFFEIMLFRAGPHVKALEAEVVFVYVIHQTYVQLFKQFKHRRHTLLQDNSGAKLITVDIRIITVFDFVQRLTLSCTITEKTNIYHDHIFK